MKSIRIGNDIRIEWPIVLSGDVEKLKDLDLTVEVRPSAKIIDTHNYADENSRKEVTVMMNGGVDCLPDIGDGKEHCQPCRPHPHCPTAPVLLPYHIEDNTLIAMWTADRQFATGDYDIMLYAHKNEGGQAVCDQYRFVRLVSHTAEVDAPDGSGIEAIIAMQPVTLSLSGLSAYEVAVVNGFQGSVEEWLESLKAGKLSSYVSVESIDNLPQQGDESTGYIIGTKLYIYVGTGGDTLEGKYKDVGEFRGPQGAPGSNGKSAYELAVEGGYEGSVEEWLLSLKGRDGVDGVNGADGLDGENGKDGVTPLIRWNNNRIEQSTDNGKSWWALSDKFNNKLYIKGYVTSADKLPKNALVGDMYGVGPIYGDDDVEQTKPYYQVYVNTVTDWAKSATITKVYQGDTELPQSAENNEIILIKKSTDNYLVYKYVNGSWNLLANLAEIYVEKDDIVNRGDNIFALVQSEIENQYELYERVVSWRNSGTFTSITAGIVNELGDSENAVMSQKAVTDAILNKIDLSAIDFDAQTIAKLALATIPTRYNVISSNKSVGIMEVFSDNNGHMVTEVFETHYIVENGALTGGHSDDKTFRYMRSYHLVEGGTSDIPVGTWGEWKQVYSSDNQNDIDTLKEDVSNLNANTSLDEYETFSDQKAYSAGDVVNYNGLLYTFKVDHAAGAWTGTDVEKTDVVKAHIAQEFGENENAVISQKVTTEAIHGILYDVEEVVKDEYKGYLNDNGEFVSTPNLTNRCTGYIKVSEYEVVIYRGGWISSAFPLVVGYTDISTGAVSLLKSESSTAITKAIIIPSGIKYIRAWGDISLINNEDVTITHKGLHEKLSNLSSLLSTSDEENIDLYLRKYDISKFPWKYGWIYIDGTTIQYNDYPKYIYSNFFIPVKKDIKLNLIYVSGIKIKVDLYDSNKVFVKMLGGFFTSLTEVTPDTDGYIRISLVNDSGFDITQLSSFVIEQDEATINERIGLLEEKITPVSTIYNGTLDGHLNANGEFVATSENENKCTEYIPVVEGQKVYYSGKWTGTQFPLMCGYSDTLGNNMIVLIPSNETLITKAITIPSGVNYIRAWSGNNVPLLLKVYKISTRRTFYIDKSGNGDFESLAEALAIINDSASNPITLIVRTGIYTMPKQLYETPWYTPSNRYVSIIGTDKSNCIIKNTYGYYAVDDYPNYDSACLRLAGNIYIANLTFISSDEDYSGKPGYNVAYCLHLDFDTDGGICEINNCKLINTHGGSCIGFGTRNNYEIKLVNCEMICEQATPYGTVWGHNGNVVNPVGNKFTMINCIVKGVDAKAIKILSAYNSQPVVAEFIGNAVFGTDGQNAAAFSNNITKSSYSCLNNISILNS